MSDQLMQSLAWLAVLGVGSQWLAWRLRLPSILLLLIAGFVAGPVIGVIQPDMMLGDMLMPLVSVSVSLILYEGGLTLKFSELKDIGHVVRNLVTIGAIATWLGSTFAAQWLLGWSTALSAVFGAIVVVTGPTVIGPLLRLVQPTKQVSSILKWEGIVIDPVGAVLALLVFEAVHAGHGLEGFSSFAALGFAKTILIGGSLGILGGEFMVQAFRRNWAPDFLQNPLSLMTVVTLFIVSNSLQHESGLLTVTVLGIWLANQNRADVRHIVEFKENLRVLLISALFILLAARITPNDLRTRPLAGTLGLLAVLMIVVRPISVLLSTLGSKLKRNERMFLCWVAPRGIVAAAVASIFSIRLVDAGLDRAEELVPVIFLLIIGTVAVYGLTALPVARALKVSSPNPQGILFVGSGPVARAMAKVLHSEGITVLLADTNRETLGMARMQGLPVQYGNVLSEQTVNRLELAGIGRLLAVTPNHEVNTLAAVHFREVFGRSEVYQLPAVQRKGATQEHRSGHGLGGRLLFHPELSFEEFNARIQAGATVKKTLLTEEFTFEQFTKLNGPDAIPLFLTNSKRELRIFGVDHPPTPGPGWSLVSLQNPKAEIPPEPSSPVKTTETVPKKDSDLSPSSKKA